MRNAVRALAVAMILVVAGGMLAAAVARVREAAGRMACQNNLRQTGFALWNYPDAYGHFPQAGEPNPGLAPERRLSWFVTLGPYYEATNLYVRLERGKGWDAEENRYLALTDMRYLQCPNFPDRPPVSTLFPSHYVGIAGLGPDAATLPAGHPRAGFFGYERKLTAADIRERSSTLLVAAETTRVSGAWTAAGPPTTRGVDEDDLPYFGLDRPFGGLHLGGANVLFADGSVRLLREPSDPRVLKAMTTIRGSEGEE
jgi:prepilin-type processing-associated H-X9-DG protein